MKNIAIVGSRTFDDYDALQDKILSAININEVGLIISGGAMGADTLAERFAKEYNIKIKIFPAQWKLYGKSAGIRRNRDIIKNADVVFLFWDGKSRGTKNSLNLCYELNKTHYLIKIKGD